MELERQSNKEALENLSSIIFNQILKYATRNYRQVKQCITWERVSRRFKERLTNNFWPSLPSVDVRLSTNPLPMTIGEDHYESINVRAFIGFQQRGSYKSCLSFLKLHISLPKEFAVSVPVPTHIDLGRYCNLNDPELLLILKLYNSQIEYLTLCCTNPTINEIFIEAFSNLTSLKQLQLLPRRMDMKCSLEMRRLIYSKLAGMAPKCLMLTSTDTPSYMNMFGEELFLALDNAKIQCLHLESLNHYIDEFLQNNLFHNRANITHLCILNDTTKLLIPSEEGSEAARLCHTIAEYRLLFPKVKFMCIVIFIDFTDDRFDIAIVLSYYKARFEIQIHLIVMLKMSFNQNWKQFSWKRFDSLLIKLRQHHAEIHWEDKDQGKIKKKLIMKSRDGRFHSEIHAFNEFLPTATCVEYMHLHNKPHQNIGCLCTCNC